MKHVLTQIHKTHHNLDLRRIITVLYIIYFATPHGGDIEMINFLAFPSGDFKTTKL
jgi:hypothetical protein